MRNRSSVDEEGFRGQDAIETSRNAAKWRYRGETVSERDDGLGSSYTPTAAGKPSILLVENDRRLCDSLASLLRVMDYEVLEVYSGVEALAALKTKEFDAAVIDVDLPDVNGVEVFRAVRGMDSELGILLIARAVSLEQAAKSLDLGADAFIVIPANPDLILFRLERVARLKGLERRLSESEARYKELIEGIDEGVFQANVEGTFLTINQAGAELLGYNHPSNMLRCRLGVWRTLFSPEKWEAIRERVLRDGQVRAVLGRFRRPNGSLGWLETTIKAVRDAEKAIVGFGGFFREVSDRIMYLETLESLQGFWADLSEMYVLEEISGLTIEFLKGVIGFDTVSIIIVSTLLLNKLDEGNWGAYSQKSLMKDRGAISRAVRTGKIQMVLETSGDRGYSRSHPAEESLSLLVVPVKLGDEVVAVIEAGSAKPGGFLDEDRKLVEIVADHVAFSIDRLVLANIGYGPGVKLKDFM